MVDKEQLLDEIFLDLLIKKGSKIMEECLRESDGMVIPVLMSMQFQNKWLYLVCQN